MSNKYHFVCSFRKFLWFRSSFRLNAEQYIVLVQLRTVYCYLYTNVRLTIENVLFSSGANGACSSALLLCPSDILSTSFHRKHSLQNSIDYFTSSEAGDRYFLVGLPHKRLAQPNFITVISNFLHSLFHIR